MSRRAAEVRHRSHQCPFAVISRRLLDHLVGALLENPRYVEAKGLGGL
jgi:hypothetical protein